MSCCEAERLKYELQAAEAELGEWIKMAPDLLSREIENDRRALHRVVMGALMDCITAHGPITERWVDSAAKRVTGQVYGYRKAEIRELSRVVRAAPAVELRAALAAEGEHPGAGDNSQGET